MCNQEATADSHVASKKKTQKNPQIFGWSAAFYRWRGI